MVSPERYGFAFFHDRTRLYKEGILREQVFRLSKSFCEEDAATTSAVDDRQAYESDSLYIQRLTFFLYRT